jgi:hypothetical protein
MKLIVVFDPAVGGTVGESSHAGEKTGAEKTGAGENWGRVAGGPNFPPRTTCR